MAALHPDEVHQVAREYGLNSSTVEDLLHDGYSHEDIGTLKEARQQIPGRPQLLDLGRFYRLIVSPEPPIDGESLIDVVGQLRADTRRTRGINLLLRQATHLKAENRELDLDAITDLLRRRKKVFQHHYSDDDDFPEDDYSSDSCP